MNRGSGGTGTLAGYVVHCAIAAAEPLGVRWRVTIDRVEVVTLTLSVRGVDAKIEVTTAAVMQAGEPGGFLVALEARIRVMCERLLGQVEGYLVSRR